MVTQPIPPTNICNVQFPSQQIWDNLLTAIEALRPHDIPWWKDLLPIFTLLLGAAISFFSSNYFDNKKTCREKKEKTQETTKSHAREMSAAVISCVNNITSLVELKTQIVGPYAQDVALANAVQKLGTDQIKQALGNMNIMFTYFSPLAFDFTLETDKLMFISKHHPVYFQAFRKAIAQMKQIELVMAERNDFIKKHMQAVEYSESGLTERKVLLAFQMLSTYCDALATSVDFALWFLSLSMEYLSEYAKKHLKNERIAKATLSEEMKAHIPQVDLLPSFRELVESCVAADDKVATEKSIEI